MNKSNATIEEIIGDPKQLDVELQAFQKDSIILSSRRVSLIAKYPKRWIAVYDGDVKTDARSLRQLLANIDTLGLPRERVVIRLIDRNLRRMIL